MKTLKSPYLKPSTHYYSRDNFFLNGKPCGFKLDQTIRELDVIRKNIPWKNWRAYKSNKMFLVDGNAYFNRPGPRIVDSIEILAYCSFPELFPDLKDKFANDIIQLQEGLELASR